MHNVNRPSPTEEETEMKMNHIEKKLMMLTVNKTGLPKGCKVSINCMDAYTEITFKLGRFTKLMFFLTERESTKYCIYVLNSPKTGYMTVNESGDIDFAFGQLVHFKEEVER